jgi:hypothetical protein
VILAHSLYEGRSDCLLGTEAGRAARGRESGASTVASVRSTAWRRPSSVGRDEGVRGIVGGGTSVGAAGGVIDWSRFSMNEAMNISMRANVARVAEENSSKRFSPCSNRSSIVSALSVDEGFIVDVGPMLSYKSLCRKMIDSQLISVPGATKSRRIPQVNQIGDVRIFFSWDQQIWMMVFDTFTGKHALSDCLFGDWVAAKGPNASIIHSRDATTTKNPPLGAYRSVLVCVNN